MAEDDDFEGGETKALIREQFDAPLIVGLFQRRGGQLSYFGLPGPHIQDLIAWQPWFSSATGVERLRPGRTDHEQDLARHRRLLNNVLKADLSNFQLLRGDIEGVILNGKDIDNHVPRNIDIVNGRTLFRYDVVNLDFCGGIGYQGPNGAIRSRALRELFIRQTGYEFLLLLTINVRDQMGPELRHFVRRLRGELPAELGRALEWYASVGAGEKEYLLKAALPLYVQRKAEDCMFQCTCLPAVAYTGSGQARLVHFAFWLRPEIRYVLQGYSEQRVSDLIEQPLLIATESTILCAAKQHPELDTTKNNDIVTFIANMQKSISIVR